MVSAYMEDVSMKIDTIFVDTVEKLALEQEKDLKELVHSVMELSTPDISLREFKRVKRPDAKNRQRSLSLREAYDFARKLGKSIDEVIAIALVSR